MLSALLPLLLGAALAFHTFQPEGERHAIALERATKAIQEAAQAVAKAKEATLAEANVSALDSKIDEESSKDEAAKEDEKNATAGLILGRKPGYYDGYGPQEGQESAVNRRRRQPGSAPVDTTTTTDWYQTDYLDDDKDAETRRRRRRASTSYTGPGYDYIHDDGAKSTSVDLSAKAPTTSTTKRTTAYSTEEVVTTTYTYGGAAEDYDFVHDDIWQKGQTHRRRRGYGTSTMMPWSWDYTHDGNEKVPTAVRSGAEALPVALGATLAVASLCL